ncbi:MAG: hypothetical protein H0V30_05470 [Chitinophagaceae bacterium]|nr:hypothetical protein [Chitinophagaceae bacterium]
MCYGSNAQLPSTPGRTSNLRIKAMATAADTLYLDSLSIIPYSLIVRGVPPSDYRFDYIRSTLVWTLRPENDTVEISYRVFPFKLDPVAQRINYDSVVNHFYAAPFEFNNNATRQQGVFNFGNLNYHGSFGRGISFGNSQDAVLNSNLNLQLSGMLGDSIEISAAITDNNIPIQPDGSTQQLNEFDQVYLQFKKKNWQLNLGDIDLRQNKSYFLNFYKRLQGVSFQTDYNLSPGIKGHTLVSGSIAKGKFNRNIFQGLEGNQGPYRLTGASNEFFFIVLAGTERVFLDGEILQRGEDQDYVINYNTAEVTFTPRRLITKDSRIQIEFEYADRNFLNANLYATQELTINERLIIRLGVFNNSDAKNSQVNQVLDVEQRHFLSTIGDSIKHAFYPTAVIDSFDAGKILYEKIYFSAGTLIDSFYQFSTDPAVAKYSLSFTDVGQGFGNYVPDFNGANGKVFRYVSPIGNQKQGRFEPISILVTPKKQQVFNIGVDYKLGTGTFIKSELAMSNYDVNTFSGKDGGDDAGFAARFQFQNTKPLRSKAENKLSLTTLLDYEYVQDKFKPLERIRNVEFTRDWGLPLITQAATENILRFSSQLKSHRNSIGYQLMNYNRSDDYNGIQQTLTQAAAFKGLTLNNQVSITNFSNNLQKGSFFKPILDISRKFAHLDNISLGGRYTMERNITRNKSTDSLSALSFAFDTYSVYLRSDDQKQNKYSITYFTRADKFPVAKDLISADRSQNINLQAEFLKNPAHQLLFNATFRKLNVSDHSLSPQQEDETILGRTEYMINEFKGLITGNVLYEVGAGQEQRRDYSYLEVPAGQGQYTWNDYDSNGVQSLNEFEIAIFTDQAKFIRLFTPTNDYVKANFNTLNYSFHINPRAVISTSGAQGINAFISRFNLQTSMQVNKKSVAKGTFEFNPFKYGLNDTALITLGTVFLNTLSFNRFNSNWGLDLSNLQNSGKSLLTYGYESRQVTDWSLKFRWNLNKMITLDLTTRKGNNELITPDAAFTNRNYHLNIFNTEPRISLIRGTVFRLVTSYKYDIKKNEPKFGGEKSISNSVNLESKYNVLQNSSLIGRFTFNNIDYDAAANTTVSYVMLDGLLPGKNYLWSLGLTKRLMNNLELSFQYDGRKPGSARTVHIGRASITALF